MSDFDWDDDDTEDAQESGAMKDLRKAYKAAQKQNKELQEQLNGLQSSLRERSVKDVLASKGLPEKIAKFIPTEATSAEEVEAWLAENGDVFGVQATATEEQPQQVNPELQAWQRISATQAGGQPFTNDPDQLAGLIANADSPEALNRLLFGNVTGPNAV
jgi:hypothetical protein